LNYHESIDDEMSKSKLKEKIKRSKVLDKKFQKLKNDIKQNLDDLNMVYEYYDELLLATNNYKDIKKIFWNVRQDRFFKHIREVYFLN
jgi:hypothetical protein